MVLCRTRLCVITYFCSFLEQIEHVNYFIRDLSVPFPTEREAQIAFGTLSVDSEPKRGGVKKELIVKGNVLNM